MQAADAALDTIEENLGKAEEDAKVLADPDLTAQEKLDRLGEDGADSVVERQRDNVDAELKQKRAEEQGLVKQNSSVTGRLVDQWARSWKWLAGIAALFLVLPSLLRTISYFVLMPVVSRTHTPIRLADDRDTENADIRSTAAKRTLTVDLRPGEVLTARSEHLRPVEGKVRDRLLYEWTSPFISFAAGLHSLSPDRSRHLGVIGA